VLDQKETPGLGAKIIADDWREQFVAMSAADAIAVTKASPAGNEISPVTGATISSESVCKIINETVAQFRAALADQNP